MNLRYVPVGQNNKKKRLKLVREISVYDRARLMHKIPVFREEYLDLGDQWKDATHDRAIARRLRQGSA